MSGVGVACGAWEGLSPPYATIVADPPWPYHEGWPTFEDRGQGDRVGQYQRRRRLPYSSLSLDEIAALPVAGLANSAAHLYLWTTNRYLRMAYDIVEGWNFKPSQVLAWCKLPMGLGPGGAFASTTEFILFARRGSLKPLTRVDSTWWQWTRGHQSTHSEKPPAFLDLVERVSPGPRVELFARAQRLGWDSWGWGYEHANPDNSRYVTQRLCKGANQSP